MPVYSALAAPLLLHSSITMMIYPASSCHYELRNLMLGTDQLLADPVPIMHHATSCPPIMLPPITHSEPLSTPPSSTA
ncbi:hypothetical protein F4778DRAFT_752850 [Xylariomycetidae sp. FL2044]|nr:hypothetical protein F4778DRAFT_752850 [Xylariomycetidae sp. FL2044]